MCTDVFRLSTGFSGASKTASTRCDDCPKGEFTHVKGQSSCKPASVGHFVEKTGASEEKECPTGYHASGSGNDLIAAVEHTTDQEKSVDVKATARAPDFKPGTNAQRHRLHHAKHGSKHGSAHASGRLSMANIFGSSGSTLSSKQRSGSGSVDALAPAEPSDRPRLARSLTWRATPPALPKEPSSSQV